MKMKINHTAAAIMAPTFKDWINNSDTLGKSKLEGNPAWMIIFTNR